ncbi:MAG: CsgG/HfaB family protein [Elusimicrobia bacterium]|nr:CsgG/HfaB family protein [Candidatus Obscuribacterium magneticum]
MSSKRTLYFLILQIVLLFQVKSEAALDPLKKMAKELSGPIRKLEKPRVGLLAFPHHDNRTSSGSTIVCERLTTYLATIPGVHVVERRLIVKLLEEQRMQEMGVIEPRTAKKLGQILGVDVIVTGTLIELNDNKVEVNARAIMSETGAIISARRTVITKTWMDRPRLSEPPKAAEPMPEETELRQKENEPIEIGYPAPSGPRGVPWRRRGR